MLTRDQLQWLEDALDENAKGDGGAILIGKTYTEMQRIFNQRMGTNLSAEGLRYHIRNLGKKGLGRGRRPYRSDSHKRIGIIGHLLLAITRWSPRRVYLLMKANTRLKYPPVSSTSFYQLLAAINLVPARLLDDQPRLLMQRYQLRLHQMMVVDVQGEVRGILLVGFEANTGLCNAQWYEMRYRRPHLKPGRPRKIPPANDEVTAYWSSVSEIRLPDGLLAEFCTECQARFFVPLTRFMLPRGYSADTIIPAIKFSQFDPIVEIASQPGSTIQLTDERAEVTIEQWRIRALRWIDRHNRHLAREVVDEEWKQIAAQLLSAAAVKKWQHWSIRDKRRTAWINDEQLRAFYRDHPRYLGQIAPICRRVKVLRLEKKPDVAGKAG